MNWTRKESSTVSPREFNLAARLVISIMCSCIVRDPSNFMVVSSAIRVPASDLSAERKRSSTDCIYSLALSVCGIVDLMLLATVILINIRLNLLLRSHALWCNFSASVLSLVRAAGLSSRSAKSRS